MASGAERGSSKNVSRPGGSRLLALEWICVAIVLVCVLLGLLSRYSLSTFSDPGKWYCFGKNFMDECGVRRLAYGFPLAVSIAIRVVGPFAALLINLPVFLCLFAILYLVSRNLADKKDEAKLCAMASIAGLLFFGGMTIRSLINPYRDPMSFLFLLVSLWCFIIAGRGGRRMLIWVAGSALSMGIACSTRETSVLMLLPLMVYGIALRLRDKSLGLTKPALVFVGVFILSLIPFFCQNARTGGNPFVPAQIMKSTVRVSADQHMVDDERETSGDMVIASQTRKVLVPPVRFEYMRTTLPKVVSYLYDRYRVWGVALLLLAVTFAVCRRNMVVLLLALPGVLLYTLFYGAYNRPVERYLFVVDLFAVPMMAYGAVSLLGSLSGMVVRRRHISRLTASVFILMTGLSCVLAVAGERRPEMRFRVSDARRLSKKLSASLPGAALVLAERPIEGIVRALSPVDSEPIIYIGEFRALRDPAIPVAIGDLLGAGKVLYAGYFTETYERYLSAEFDLREGIVLNTRDFGLTHKLAGCENLSFRNICGWSRKKSVKALKAPAGRYRLDVDVGDLSRYERSYVCLKLDGKVLDDGPLAFVNHYLVSLKKGRSELVLESDGLVPGNLWTSLRSCDDPIYLNWEGDNCLLFGHRLTPAWVPSKDARYPVLCEKTSISVPTMAPGDAQFNIQAILGVVGDRSRTLRIRVGDMTLKRKDLGEGWQNVSFRLESPPTQNTICDFLLDDSRGECPVLLKSMAITRWGVSDHFRVDLGDSASDSLILKGLYGVEGSEDLKWRWTTRDARVKLILRETDKDVKIRIQMLTEHRPQEAGPLDLKFLLGGEDLKMSLSKVENSGVSRLEAVGTASGSLFKGNEAVLEIHTRPWIPADVVGGDDRRELGIMLYSIELNAEGIDVDGADNRE